MANSEGFTLWFTGLPGAGKSTLARSVQAALGDQGHEHIEIFDEDDASHPLLKTLDFQEWGVLANLLARNGVIVIVAAKSPKRAMRKAIRRQHTAPMIEIFLDAPLAVLIDRDTKGFYRNFLGENAMEIHQYFERPLAPDIQINTWGQTVAESTQILVDLLETYLEMPKRRIQLSPIFLPEKLLRRVNDEPS